MKGFVSCVKYLWMTPTGSDIDMINLVENCQIKQKYYIEKQTNRIRANKRYESDVIWKKNVSILSLESLLQNVKFRIKKFILKAPSCFEVHAEPKKGLKKRTNFVARIEQWSF